MTRAQTGPVGVRELRNRLSEVLRRVRAGDSVAVTDRHRVIARIVPCPGDDAATLAARLAEVGRIAWGGGRPRGLHDAPVVRGPGVADAVIEDRR